MQSLRPKTVAELVKSFERVNEILDGFRYKMGGFSTLLGERHHFRLPVAERVKRFVGFAARASASKALTASATRKQAFVEFWW